MSLSYKKLWKQLIDRDMTRTELRQATGISPERRFARFDAPDSGFCSTAGRLVFHRFHCSGSAPHDARTPRTRADWIFLGFDGPRREVENIQLLVFLL